MRYLHIMTVVVELDAEPQSQQLRDMADNIATELLENWGPDRSDGFGGPYIQRVDVALNGLVLATETA